MRPWGARARDARARGVHRGVLVAVVEELEDRADPRGEPRREDHRPRGRLEQHGHVREVAEVGLDRCADHEEVEDADLVAHAPAEHGVDRAGVAEVECAAEREVRATVAHRIGAASVLERDLHVGRARGVFGAGLPHEHLLAVAAALFFEARRVRAQHQGDCRNRACGGWTAVLRRSQP